MEDSEMIKDRLHSNSSKSDMASGAKGSSTSKSSTTVIEEDTEPKSMTEVWKLLQDMRKSIADLKLDPTLMSGMEKRLSSIKLLQIGNGN